MHNSTPLSPFFRQLYPAPTLTYFMFNIHCNSVLSSVIRLTAFRADNQYHGFRGLEVACWPLVPKLSGSNPAEAVGFLGRKNPQRAFLRRFSACKRSINLSGSRNLDKITGHPSRPQFHLSLLGSLASLRTCRHLAAKVGTSKGGGKQWQTTPKNLSKMQCARAIPVT